MKINSFILSVLIAAFSLAFLPPAAAEQPGGQTVGGVSEKKSKLKAGDSRVVFNCNNCLLPACVTFQRLNNGNVTLFTFDPNTPKRPFDPVKQRTETRCTLALNQVNISCLGGEDCEYSFRIDQLGPPIQWVTDPQ